jgi:hypothetical protein
LQHLPGQIGQCAWLVHCLGDEAGLIELRSLLAALAARS